VAYLSSSDITGYSLFLCTADGSRRLAWNISSSFCWSPDGTKLALFTGQDVLLIDRHGQECRRFSIGVLNVESLLWFPKM
jgi:hypothetical protein